MLKRFLMFLAGIAFVCSCNKSADLLSSGNPEGEVMFTTHVVSPEFSVSTKAAAVTALSSFYASATTGSAGSEASVWNSVSFVSDGAATPTYSADKWWPSSDPSYHFYASNSAITFNAAGSTISPTTALDAVVAYMVSPVYKAKNTLTFEHVFARIGEVTVSAAEGYTVSNVSITVTPNTGGTYNIRTGVWSGVSAGSATELFDGAGAKTMVYGTTTSRSTSNDLYLVPGDYTLSATWTATKGSFTKTYTAMPADVSLAAGKVNSLSVTLTGDASNLVFGVAVTPWVTGAPALVVEVPTVPPPPEFTLYWEDEEGNSDDPVVVGDDIIVRLYASDDEGPFSVLFKKDGFICYRCDDVFTSDGRTSLAMWAGVEDLVAGTYELYLGYNGYEYPSGSFIEIEKADPSVEFETDVDEKYPGGLSLAEGEVGQFSYILPEDAEGVVTFIVDGIEYDCPVVGGRANWEFSSYEGGTNHTLDVVYSGDDRYNSVISSFYLEIRYPLAMEFTIDPEPFSILDDVELTVDLTSDATGTVSFEIEGIGIISTVNVSGGKASYVMIGGFDEAGLGWGNYVIMAHYSGDSLYPSKTIEKHLEVSGLPSSIQDIIISDPTYPDEATIRVSVNDGATGTVSIRVFNNDISRGMEGYIEAGYAFVRVEGLAVGSYNVEAYYYGDDRYERSETCTASFDVLEP